jgi:hypothetical protein
MDDFGPDFITQRYLRRYPNSKRTRSWAGVPVHIQTENGVWRVGGSGYTWVGKPNAWILPFEEAMKKIDHCGPEKMGRFIRAEQPGKLYDGGAKALAAADAITRDMMKRGVLLAERGDDDELRTVELDRQFQIKASWQTIIVEALAANASAVIARSATPAPVPSLAGDLSIQPPPNWAPNNGYAILPQSLEEWDWRQDAPENTPWLRSKKRLHAAGCQADPRAPDQMAIVLRIDLIRVIGRLTWLNARYGYEPDASDLEKALDAFWNVAYTQGEEQRGHDDAEGTAQKAEGELRRSIEARVRLAATATEGSTNER